MRDDPVKWSVFVRRFARLGFFGFGGPPAHVVLMRRQWVDSDVIDAAEFNDAFAAVSLLPGPASPQLSAWLGWRLRGYAGLFVASALFITPAVAGVLVLSWLVLGARHPVWLSASALGAAAVVPAIALRAGVDLARGYQLGEKSARAKSRVALYGAVGVATCLVAPSALAIAMIAGGLCEIAVVRASSMRVVGVLGVASTKASLTLLALKVGALSFGGGFVIVPMMRADAVTTHHWMSGAAFVTAVAIGQLTPGPVVATIAAIGYAVGGWGDGLLAAAVAFAPSLLFVSLGARHLVALRQRASVRAFLDGAGPVATGAILASAWLLAHACTHQWQWPIVAVSVVLVVAIRRSPTPWLVLGALVGLFLGVVAHVGV